jgi:cytochrome c-type biogenesis protein CcmH/NrfF
MNSLLACTSHLLVDLPLFAGPAVMVIGAIVLIARRERRRGSEGRERLASFERRREA